MPVKNSIYTVIMQQDKILPMFISKCLAKTTAQPQVSGRVEAASVLGLGGGLCHIFRFHLAFPTA